MLVAAAVTYLTTPLIRRIARRIGAITPVRDRDVHAVAILTASRMSFLEGKFEGGQPWGVLLGAAVVCMLGIADDLWQLDAVTKLAGHAIAAGRRGGEGGPPGSLPGG